MGAATGNSQLFTSYRVHISTKSRLKHRSIVGLVLRSMRLKKIILSKWLS